MRFGRPAGRVRFRPVKPRIGIVISTALCLLLPASASASASPSGSVCPAEQIRTASGCESFAAAGRHVRAIVEQFMQEQDLRAALVRVDVGDRTLAALASGDSMAGEPANLRMNFRIGSIAIPYLIDVLLQLQDRGMLSLDDPISEWFPELPNASEVTLRMLASATSGYPDWVQGNPAFVEELLADPFRQWKTQELLDAAFAQPLICDPGACFHYAHTGFVILGKVVSEITGQSLARLMRTRVLGPLGLRHTEISALPAIPHPVLHSYLAFRGFYEDATYWSPSWGISKSLLMTATIGDSIRSAKALGTGALVSAEAQRQRLAPITIGLGGPDNFSNAYYYGLGLRVSNSWQFQNPHLNGFNSISAYLPSRRIAVALSVTDGQTAAENTDSTRSEQLFGEISSYLSPNHPAWPPS
jgi:D-alanyl-D-alanine carboxypeptidase